MKIIIDASWRDGESVSFSTVITEKNEHLLPLVRKVAQVLTEHTPNDGVYINWYISEEKSWGNDKPPEEQYAGFLTKEEVDTFNKEFIYGFNHCDEIYLIFNIILVEKETKLFTQPFG